jgi:malate dehydrogenase (oxaloacetate-decarboxylating)(NADP+)
MKCEMACLLTPCCNAVNGLRRLFPVSFSGNNAYIFPGVGLGTLATSSTRITDHDMYVAAKTLAEQVTEKELSQGRLYPPLEKIREVSASIAAAVAENAFATGTATERKPRNMMEYIQSLMYDPFEDPFAAA